MQQNKNIRINIFSWKMLFTNFVIFEMFQIRQTFQKPLNTILFV